MRRFIFILALTVFASLAIPASAQPPLIYSRHVYNAASYFSSGIPAGAIARGSIFSLFGERIGPAQPATANSFPLGTNLGGVAINVFQGGTTVSAIPVYVSATQINAIMPSNAPLGAASVQVIVGNFRSNPHPVRIANSAFGIFTVLGTGLGPGVLQNFIASDNQPVNSTTVTAQKGQAIILWGTGLGPVAGGDNVAPKAGNLATKVEVYVGGVSAPVQYSGRAPCCAGTDQIVFTVPANAPSGCWVPVYVRTEGSIVSNFVSIAIQPNGGVCTTDVLPEISSIIVNGGRFAEAVELRATTRHDVGVTAPVDVTTDYHYSYAFAAHAAAFPFGPFPLSPTATLPPSGTCTVYTHQGDILAGDLLPGMIPTAAMPLDLGAPFMLNGPKGSRTLSNDFSGVRAGYLGGAISNNILPSYLYLDPGSYTLTGSGGMDVGAFSTSFTIPAPLTWTNRDQLNYIDRTQPLTLSWTGADSGQVISIVGFGEDLPTNSSAAFACIAPQGASSFTVPPDILSNLPPARSNPLQSKDVLYLLTLEGSTERNLNASGVDVGMSAVYSIFGKTVVLQ